MYHRKYPYMEELFSLDTNIDLDFVDYVIINYKDYELTLSQSKKIKRAAIKWNEMHSKGVWLYPFRNKEAEFWYKEEVKTKRYEMFLKERKGNENDKQN